MASIDRIFELLSKERRRYALDSLDQHDGPVPVDEIAEELFERIGVELHHVESPKAAETTYIQYDREERVVELTGPPPAFDAIISIAEGIERPDRYP